MTDVSDDLHNAPRAPLTQLHASTHEFWQSDSNPMPKRGVLYHTSPPKTLCYGDPLRTFIPSIYDYTGITIDHNMPCCVLKGDAPAVYNMSEGVFEPSWKAQAVGWHLVKADTKLKKWILKFFNFID